MQFLLELRFFTITNTNARKFISFHSRSLTYTEYLIMPNYYILSSRWENKHILRSSYELLYVVVRRKPWFFGRDGLQRRRCDAGTRSGSTGQRRKPDRPLRGTPRDRCCPEDDASAGPWFLLGWKRIVQMNQKYISKILFFNYHVLGFH